MKISHFFFEKILKYTCNTETNVVSLHHVTRISICLTEDYH
jgi:hypothetical protein